MFKKTVSSQKIELTPGVGCVCIHVVSVWVCECACACALWRVTTFIYLGGRCDVEFRGQPGGGGFLLPWLSLRRTRDLASAAAGTYSLSYLTIPEHIPWVLTEEYCSGTELRERWPMFLENTQCRSCSCSGGQTEGSRDVRDPRQTLPNSEMSILGGKEGGEKCSARLFCEIFLLPM